MEATVADRVRTVMDAASMSQAAFAERVGLTPDKLSKSLKGVRRFTSLDLALIAEAGCTTVDWLLSGREPLRPSVAARTRSGSGSGSGSGSAPGRAGVEDVTGRFATAYDVLDLLGRSPGLPELPHVRDDLRRFVDQGEALAADTHEHLRAAGVPSVAALATDQLIAAVERCCGVDVAITDIPEAVDGLAWQTDAFRLVLVEPTKVWTRQRFTLAHELGHILARDARAPIAESHLAPGHQKDLTEVRANVFAAHLLMPAQDLTDAVAGDHLTDDAFRDLVVRFKVSPSALSARLGQLGLLSPEDHARLRGTTTETCHLLAGAADAYQRQESWASAHRYPPRIASELFRAYADGETTLRPLAALLDVDVDHLHDLLDPAPGPGIDEGDLVFRP
ncbi:helix-turn-helix domain-containing protein [Streptomyces sp. NPDC001700]